MPEPVPVAKPIWKTATFWAGLGTIVTTVGGYVMGLGTENPAVDLASMIEVCGLALVGIFIRRGMKK